MATDLSYDGYTACSIRAAENGYIINSGGKTFVYSTLKAAIKAVTEALEAYEQD